MTIDYNAAAEALRRRAVQYQSDIEVADLFEKMGSIEAATREAEARRVKTFADAEKAKINLDTAHQQIADAEKTAALTASAAQTRADSIVVQAKVSAADVVKDANMRAAQVTADAKAQADALIKQTRDDFAAVLARSEVVMADIRAGQETLAGINVSITAAQDQLDGIRAAIAKYTKVG